MYFVQDNIKITHMYLTLILEGMLYVDVKTDLKSKAGFIQYVSEWLGADELTG